MVKQEPSKDMIQKHQAQAMVIFYLKTWVHKAATGSDYEYAQLHAQRSRLTAKTLITCNFIINLLKCVKT